MVKWKLICLIAVALLLVTDEVKGKDNSLMYSDAGSWNTFSISYAFNKKLALLFTEELRLKENYSRLNLFYTNVGVEYTSTRVIDRAIQDRFQILEMDILTKEQQANLINQICPNLTEQTVDILTSIYSQIQIEVQSGSGKISTGISTRTILGAAALICDGFSIQSALEVCVFPYFSNDGGMDSERTFARQIVQKFIPHSDLKNDNMFDETDTNTF